MKPAGPVPIKEVLTLHDSGVWAKDDPEEGISVLRSVNFQNDGSLDLTKLAFKAIEHHQRLTKRLQEGDILIEKSGGGPKQPVGRACIFMGDAREHVFGNFVARLRTNRNLCEPKYLFWFLWNFHRTGRTEGYQKQTTGIRNLEFTRYLSVPIPLPPLPQQRRIVDILNRANGVRRLRREALDKSRQLMPALFVSMFGDPVNDPRQWPVSRLDELVDQKRGISYGIVQRGDDVDNGVPVVRISNIIKNTYDAGGMVRTSPDVSNRHKRTLLKGGELLLSIRGTVGSVAIAPHGAREHNVSREIAVIPLLTNVDREYIWALMLADGAQRFLAGEVRGIAQSGINLRDVCRLPVALPPEPMQHEFAERAAEIHSIMTSSKACCEPAISWSPP